MKNESHYVLINDEFYLSAFAKYIHQEIEKMDGYLTFDLIRSQIAPFFSNYKKVYNTEKGKKEGFLITDKLIREFIDNCIQYQFDLEIFDMAKQGLIEISMNEKDEIILSLTDKGKEF